ncbi:MAG: NAD(P)H-dependent oxidoreductase [Kiritimatiellae bacterium]|nr:NAD(P)H-dependent oxidoreductase [Kiritimatiellia bacterium]
MAKVLIVYYSRTGNTRKMAQYVAEGVKKSGAEVAMKSVQETDPDDLLAADGVIMGSPTYYGGMAAEMKQLLDDSVRLHGQLEGKVGGAFSSSGNVGGGNETTVLDILQAMLIHGMVIPGSSDGDHYGPVSVDAPDKRAARECEKMGQIVGSLAVKLSG